MPTKVEIVNRALSDATVADLERSAKARLRRGSWLASRAFAGLSVWFEDEDMRSAIFMADGSVLYLGATFEGQGRNEVIANGLLTSNYRCSTWQANGPCHACEHCVGGLRMNATPFAMSVQASACDFTPAMLAHVEDQMADATNPLQAIIDRDLFISLCEEILLMGKRLALASLDSKRIIIDGDFISLAEWYL